MNHPSEGTSTLSVSEFRFQQKVVLLNFISDITPFLDAGCRIESGTFTLGRNNEVSLKLGISANGTIPIASIIPIKQESSYIWIKEAKCSVLHENHEVISASFPSKTFYIESLRNDDLTCNIGQHAVRPGSPPSKGALPRSPRHELGDTFKGFLTDGNLMMVFTGTVVIPSCLSSQEKSKDGGLIASALQNCEI